MKEKEPMCEPDEEELSDGWEYMRKEKEMRERYWEAVWKSDGFDLEDLTVEKPPEVALFSFDSPIEEDYNKSIICYAKLGIHRYNMFEDKNLQFSSMVKYNYVSPSLGKSTKFITCVARDPDCGGSLQPFQSAVVEQRLRNRNEMIVSCYIARPKSDAYVSSIPTHTRTTHMLVPRIMPCDSTEERDDGCTLPRWPSSEKAFMDKTQYYLLKRSEVQEYDFIRLYLELAFTKANTYLESLPDLTKLIITKVAVKMGQGEQPQKERIETGDATFYIKYKYSPKNCRSPRNRIAIVRRIIDRETARLNLVFNKCLVKTFL